MSNIENAEFYPVNFREKQRLVLPYGISVCVRKKRVDREKGNTPYYFSYSFKGEQEGSPIIPKDLLWIACELKAKLDNRGQTLIAFDRGGTALGVALSLITGLPLFIAFGYEAPLDQGISWHEPGGGKYLGIPNIPEGSNVVLVDDEINTGTTFVNAINTLRDHSITVDQISVVVEVDRKGSKGRQLVENQGCALTNLYLIPEPIYNDAFGDYVFP